MNRSHLVKKTITGQENHHSGMPTQKLPLNILMLLEENNKQRHMSKIELE